MEEVKFKKLTGELCSSKNLTIPAFKKIILKYIPGIEKELDLWLESNEYPDHIKLKNI